MSKLLWLSDSPTLHTGFANQSRKVCSYLKNNGQEIDYIAPHMPLSETITHLKMGDEVINYNIVPGGVQPHAIDVLPQYLMSGKYSKFVTLLDTFMLYPVITKIPFSLKSAFWFPSDGGYFPTECDKVLNKYSIPVAMSKFGQKQVKKLYDIKAEYIPHGIDVQKYIPLNNEMKKVLRARYSNQFFTMDIQRTSDGVKYAFRQVIVDLNKKFIVGMVARNQPRKFNERMLRTFAFWAKDKDDVIFLMHTDPLDGSGMANGSLPILVERLGIKDKVLWTGMNLFNAYNDNRMVELYNLFDVFFLTTSGEGFGIPFIESMSCGVPVIAPAYTTVPEIVMDNDAGWGIKLAEEDDFDVDSEKLRYGAMQGSWEVDRAISSIRHGIDCLNDAYYNRDKVLKRGINGRKAVLKDYEFGKNVGDKWLRIL